MPYGNIADATITNISKSPMPMNMYRYVFSIEANVIPPLNGAPGQVPRAIIRKVADTYPHTESSFSLWQNMTAGTGTKYTASITVNNVPDQAGRIFVAFADASWVLNAGDSERSAPRRAP